MAWYFSAADYYYRRTSFPTVFWRAAAQHMVVRSASGRGSGVLSLHGILRGILSGPPPHRNRTSYSFSLPPGNRIGPSPFQSRPPFLPGPSFDCSKRDFPRLPREKVFLPASQYKGELGHPFLKSPFRPPDATWWDLLPPLSPWRDRKYTGTLGPSW